jgi:hypothetical protein
MGTEQLAKWRSENAGNNMVGQRNRAIKHEIRVKGGKTKIVTLTRKKAIRLFCVECMGFSPIEPANCTAPLCPLYPYRLGRLDAGYIEMPDDEVSDDDDNA